MMRAAVWLRVMALAVLGTAGLAHPAAAAGIPALYLVSPSAQLTAGHDYEVVVRVKSVQPLSSVQLTLTYSSNLSFEGIAAQGSAFETAMAGSGGQGSIRLGRGTAQPVAGDLNVATLKLRAVSTGWARLGFAAGSLAVDAGGQALPAASAGTTYRIVAARPEPQPAAASVSPVSIVTVAVRDGQGKGLSGAEVTLGSSQLTTDSDGSAQFVGVSPGRRLLAVSYRGQEQLRSLAVVQGSHVNAAFSFDLPAPWWSNNWWVLLLAALILAPVWHAERRRLSALPGYLRRLFKLQPHHHSGRRLPHAHTSYAGTAFVLIMTGLVLASVSFETQAAGISDGLAAQLAGPVPTQAAVVTSPASGGQVTSLPVRVMGSCQAGMEVRIYTLTLLRGSQLCTANGNFDLPVNLDPGVNLLTARTFSLGGLEGPAGDGLLVRFAPAAGSPEAALVGPASGQRPDPMHLTSDQPLVADWTGQAIQWTGRLSGGLPPYAVQVDWGDGSIDLASQAKAGSLALDYTYRKAGTYNVKLTVRDSLGLSGYLQLAAVVRSPQPAALTSNPSLPNLLVAWPLYAAACLMLISFWLGERFEQDRVRQAARPLVG